MLSGVWMIQRTQKMLAHYFNWTLKATASVWGHMRIKLQWKCVQTSLFAYSCTFFVCLCTRATVAELGLFYFSVNLFMPPVMVCLFVVFNYKDTCVFVWVETKWVLIYFDYFSVLCLEMMQNVQRNSTRELHRSTSTLIIVFRCKVDVIYIMIITG